MVVRLDWMNLAGKRQAKGENNEGESVRKRIGSVFERIDDSFIKKFHFQEIRISLKWERRRLKSAKLNHQLSVSPKEEGLSPSQSTYTRY